MIHKFFNWKHHEFAFVGFLGLVCFLSAVFDGAIAGLGTILAIAYIVFKKKLS